MSTCDHETIVPRLEMQSLAEVEMHNKVSTGLSISHNVDDLARADN